MLNYYKANYPKPDAPPPPENFTFPKVKVPVLMFHGLEDQALLPGAPEWHVAVGGEGFDHHDRAWRESLRATGCAGAGQQHDGGLAVTPQAVTAARVGCSPAPCRPRRAAREFLLSERPSSQCSNSRSQAIRAVGADREVPRPCRQIRHHVTRHAGIRHLYGARQVARAGAVVDAVASKIGQRRAVGVAGRRSPAQRG